MLAIFKQSIQHTQHKLSDGYFFIARPLESLFYRLSTVNLPCRLEEGGHESVILILEVSPPEILPEFQIHCTHGVEYQPGFQ